LTIKQREYIKESKESIRKLAKRFGVSPTTIFKWRHRENLEDLSSRPKRIKRSLKKWGERVIVKVRRHLKLSIDDLVAALERYIPKINRTNCYRVLKAYRLNKLPKPFREKGKFGTYLPGVLTS